MSPATAVRERPILFSGEMVRAILDGRKTQTRRVVKPQPVAPVVAEHNDIVFHAGMTRNLARVKQSRGRNLAATGNLAAHPFPCPYGAPGDLLYVRETWAQVTRGLPEIGGRFIGMYQIPHIEEGVGELLYRATDDDGLSDQGFIWRPSIHMPKWAARIWLRATDVRVERVSEISEADALAEGIREVTKDGEVKKYCVYDHRDMSSVRWADMDRNPIDTFAALWDSLNADRGYDFFGTNPWVWVVSFERAEAPRG